MTADGDEKATNGKAAFEAVLDEDDVPYVSVTINALDDDTVWSDAVNELLSQGCDKNMVQWVKGSVQGLEPDSTFNTISEHMASFDFAYKVTAIRDWLFTQAG